MATNGKSERLQPDRHWAEREQVRQKLSPIISNGSKSYMSGCSSLIHDDSQL